MEKKENKKEPSSNYWDNTKWCGSRIALEYEEKLQVILGDISKKQRKKCTVRRWLEEKIEEEYKNIT